MHIYAADVQAIAESITALTVVGAVGAWTLRTSKTAVSRLRRRRHEQLVQVLSTEVASGSGMGSRVGEPGGIPRGWHRVCQGCRPRQGIHRT